MDMYFSDCFGIDDLLDFSNEELTTSSSSSSADSHHHQPPLPPPQSPFLHHHNQSSSDTFNNFPSTDFTADLCVPSDDVAELEWLSQFVDNCFHNFPAKEMMLGSSALQSDTSFHSKARSKSSRVSALEDPVAGKSRPKTEANGGSFSSSGGGSGVRRCAHCASEKTPQWRTGPLGPKTLCNACGVRYKSGRLVPEYRPASSPTFVLTQHSNSHRKVLELRRQKERVLMRQQEQQNKQHQQEQCYLHQHGFKDC